MASKLKSAAAADARTTAKINTEAKPKKEPVKREDPIARAKRLYEEAVEAERVRAAKLMTNATQELDKAKASLEKAARIYTERSERVATLQERAGGDWAEIPTIGQLLTAYLPGMFYIEPELAAEIEADAALLEAEDAQAA